MQPQPSCLDIDEHRIRVRMKDLRIGDVTSVEADDGYYTIGRTGDGRISSVRVYTPDGEIKNFTSKRTSGGGWAECIQAVIDIITTGDIQPESADEKRCCHCRKLLPRTREFFHYNTQNADGYEYRCIRCRIDQSAQNYRNRKARQ